MSDKLDALLGLERSAMVPAEGAAARTSAKLLASIASGAPLVVDLAPSAVASALSAQVGLLGIVGWSIAGVAIAAGIWSFGARPEVSPPPVPAPERAASVVTSSTSTVVAAGPASVEPKAKRPRRVALKPAPKVVDVPPPPDESPSPPTPAPSLADELSLVRRAQIELKRGVPAAALSLVLEHEAKFPKGALVEERWALKAIILCRMGRRAEGRGEAERFLSAHPGSPQSPRVRSECMGE